MTYTGLNRKVYSLGSSPIGSGGEGAVYKVDGENDKAAKLYNKDRFKTDDERRTTERKLRAMIRMNIPSIINGDLRLAWPQDILYENGVMVGFIMPLVDTKYGVYDMYRCDKGCVRDKIYPKNNWKYSVQFAYNMAWIVNYVHSKGIVIGDLNQKNIAVNEKSGVAILLDCDSFDITDPDTGEHFPCTVGFGEVLAPELQPVGSLRNVKFTKESDRFSLAIHIFRFLMNNADPFGGVITLQESQSEIIANRAIMNGECCYVKRVEGKKIPKWSLDFDMLPDSVIKLFIKTFDYTATNALQKAKSRATAYEWCEALAPLGKEEPNSRLKTCAANSKHVYPAHNSSCPFCRLENPDRADGSERLYAHLEELKKPINIDALIALKKNRDKSKDNIGVKQSGDEKKAKNEDFEKFLALKKNRDKSKDNIGVKQSGDEKKAKNEDFEKFLALKKNRDKSKDNIGVKQSDNEKKAKNEEFEKLLKEFDDVTEEPKKVSHRRRRKIRRRRPNRSSDPYHIIITILGLLCEFNCILNGHSTKFDSVGLLATFFLFGTLYIGCISSVGAKRYINGRHPVVWTVFMSALLALPFALIYKMSITFGTLISFGVDIIGLTATCGMSASVFISFSDMDKHIESDNGTKIHRSAALYCLLTAIAAVLGMFAVGWTCGVTEFIFGFNKETLILSISVLGTLLAVFAGGTGVYRTAKRPAMCILGALTALLYMPAVMLCAAYGIISPDTVVGVLFGIPFLAIYDCYMIYKI